MDVNKFYEFFQPEKVKEPIHVVGVGSVGSAVAELLVRSGMTKFVIYDFDVVEPKNVSNQIYTSSCVGKPKVDALKDILLEINPDVDITVYPNGWTGQVMSGYIFLCVDNIDLRREIVKKHLYNMNVKAVFDFRTMLTSAQHYAANWGVSSERTGLLRTMDYTHEQAKADTPVSACGETLGVASTVRLVSAFGVNNFINFVKGEGLKNFVEMDGFSFHIDAF